MDQKSLLVGQIADALQTKLIPIPGSSMSAADIDQRIEALDQEFQELFAAARDNGRYMKYAEDFKRITDAVAELKMKRVQFLDPLRSRNGMRA